MGCQNSTSVPVVDSESSIPSSAINSRTRILQDEIVDYCSERPLPEEPKCYLLEDDFVDGLLGLRSEITLQDQLSSLSEEELFQDPDFLADSSSLTFSNFPNPELQTIEWKRPHELCENPKLFVDGTSGRDVCQGELGDCWLLSACSAVAKRQDLIEKVVDPSQPLYGEGYKGALVVSFWRFGEWVTVHIDDKLPTREGKLIYGSCKEEEEFWVAVIEKAYAKLYGSYEALGGGHALEAFVDLTGGLAERILLKPDLFNQLRSMFAHGAFMTCSKKGSRRNKKNGLVQGHAYTISYLTTVIVMSGDTVCLVRLRNPWGNSGEFEGAWSTSSTNWMEISENDKTRLKYNSLPDGEFWMEFDDFQREFHDITIATIGPDFNQDGQEEYCGQKMMLFGCWKTGLNAGGCRNDIEKFSTNPQYLMTLTEPDDLLADIGEHGKCSILIGLLQEHRRSVKDREVKQYPIGLFVYKTETPDEKLDAEYFLCVPEEANSGSFTNSREILVRANLKPGNYVIIPATFEPDCETNYILRVYALKAFSMQEIIPVKRLTTIDEEFES